MSVFLTPDGRPFYGGTYFPPTRRYGMPSFTESLIAVSDAWQNRRQELTEGSQHIVEVIQRQNTLSEVTYLNPATLESAFQALLQSFDTVQGGWGSGPEFP